MTIAMGHMIEPCQHHLGHTKWDGVLAVGLDLQLTMVVGLDPVEWKYTQQSMIQPITVQYLLIHHFGELCPDVMVKRLI